MDQFIAVDPQRCIGCGTCLLACSEAHKKVGRQDYPRLNLIKTRDVSATVACHHCISAPCQKVCPVDSIQQQEDGCVVVDERRCIGCKLCAIACPFGAILMSGTPIAGVEGIEYPTPTFVASLSPILQWEVGVYSCAVKCDLCSFKEQGPSCLDVCPTRAIHLVNEESTQAINNAKRRVNAAVFDGLITNGLDADVSRSE